MPKSIRHVQLAVALLVAPDVLVKATTIRTAPLEIVFDGFSFGELMVLFPFLVLRVVGIREIGRASRWGRFLGGMLLSLPLYQVLGDFIFWETSAWTLIHAMLLPACMYFYWVIERSPVGRAYFPPPLLPQPPTANPRPRERD